MVASIRTLQKAYNLKVELLRLPLHRRASPAQLVVLALALVVGVSFTSYLIGYVRGFQEGCARGIRDAMAQRAV